MPSRYNIPVINNFINYKVQLILEISGYTVRKNISSVDFVDVTHYGKLSYFIVLFTCICLYDRILRQAQTY